MPLGAEVSEVIDLADFAWLASAWRAISESPKSPGRAFVLPDNVAFPEVIG